MDAQENNPIFERIQSDPECLFQITEEDDPNTKEPSFFVKIVITKEIKARMVDLQKNKKERLAKLDEKEKSPKYIALKQKMDAYRKLDQKSYEQQRKKNQGTNELNLGLAQQQGLKMCRQKLFFPLFDSFQNRGKSPYIKFSYTAGSKYLSIRINKDYFLNTLNLSRRDLFNIAISFTRTWQLDFNGMIRVLWKLYIQIQKPQNYNVYIRSLDLISVTFDVTYTDKKTYRFRFSPFEFRTSPTFKDDNQLTGYYQTISCIPQLNPNTKYTITDSDYYTQHRFFIFDDLTDGNIFHKILNRSNLFYQVYSISRGNSSYYQSLNEADDFIKKCLGQFYLSTIRMKKFIFTWSIKQFRKGDRNKKQAELQKQSKEIVLNISFQLQRDSLQVQEPAYKMKMQILEMNRLIPNLVKDDISYRIKEWYLLNKEVHTFKERTLFQNQRNMLSRTREKDTLTEDYQIPINFSSKDRFDKFFIGLLLLVSTSLDRHYFTICEEKQKQREKKRQRQIQKTIVLETSQTTYSSIKRQYMSHIHSLKLIFKHTYMPNVFHSLCKEQDKSAFESFVKSSSRNNQYRLKFGEWKLQKILKIKKRSNIKNKEEVYQPEEAQLTTFPEEFKRYISALIKHFPLRVVFKDILSFVESVCKICYSPQEQINLVTLNPYDHILRTIVNALLNQYYYSQARKESPKDKNQEKEKEQDTKKEEILENAKRQKLQESFSRVLFIKILSRGQIGFIPEQKIICQVTFKLMQCKTMWQTRLKEGYIVLRVFQDRVEFEKDYCFVSSIKGDIKNKKIFDEAAIKSHIQGCFMDPKLIITL